MDGIKQPYLFAKYSTIVALSIAIGSVLNEFGLYMVLVIWSISIVLLFLCLVFNYQDQRDS